MRGKMRQKCRFLGDIPILGHLFRSSNIEKEKKNLVIFLTPKIVDVRELYENLNLVKGGGVKEKKIVEMPKLSSIENQEQEDTNESSKEVLKNLSDSEKYEIREKLEKIQQQEIIQDILR